ncbi:hypothetical protein EGM88_04975 [Aureibaculum marinum]|uniref:Phenylalanyl-tRNA synthetase subunit alpha n=1 Tax=Aureibaculum marinum TaxID=2487930 RepID=A0A3N4NWB0_9FLAO|nr:hypothetical protein [Aureibaculum marinum]RPD98548.1 hypothetical protein EGM88_04975 [Aureibaculum marinum]
MKKDIEIPEVKDVYIAIVKEYNKLFKNYDWNAYIINNKTVDLEMVLIVTSGFSENKSTATLRRKLDKLPAKSYAKLELIPEELFALNNIFKVSFFEENKMYDKTYVFRKNTINEKALQPIPVMDVKGVLVK